MIASTIARAGSVAVFLTAVLALVAAGVGGASPAEAAEGDTSVDQRLEIFEGAQGDTEGTADAQQDAQQLDGSGCFDDDAGDTHELESGDPSTEARADIVEHCVSFGSLLGLRLTVDEPTDPQGDANWDFGTFAAWSLDTNDDGNGDYFVDYSLHPSDGSIEARVSDVSVDPAEQTCTVAGTFDGDTYRVGAIHPDCIGGAASVQVQAGMFYDAPDNGDRTVHYDTAPDDDTFDSMVVQDDSVVCAEITASPFLDRSSIAPAHRDSVDCGYEHGLILGIPAGGGEVIFDPSSNVNRGQFTAFMHRTLPAVQVDPPALRTPDFGDVPPSHTFHGTIHSLAGGDIVRGFPGNIFRPADPIVRGQTASILVQAYEFATGDELTADDPSTHFADIAGNVHAGNIDAGFEEGLVRGTTAPSAGQPGLYSPGNPTTRQQMASVLINFIQVHG